MPPARPVAVFHSAPPARVPPPVPPVSARFMGSTPHALPVHPAPVARHSVSPSAPPHALPVPRPSVAAPAPPQPVMGKHLAAHAAIVAPSPMPARSLPPKTISTPAAKSAAAPPQHPSAVPAPARAAVPPPVPAPTRPAPPAPVPAAKRAATPAPPPRGSQNRAAQHTTTPPVVNEQRHEASDKKDAKPGGKPDQK